MAKKITVWRKNKVSPISVEAGQDQDANYSLNGDWVELFLDLPNQRRKIFFLLSADEISSIEMEY